MSTIRKKAIVELPETWERGKCNTCPFCIFEEYNYKYYCLWEYTQPDYELTCDNCKLNVNGEHIEHLQQEKETLLPDSATAIQRLKKVNNLIYGSQEE